MNYQVMDFSTRHPIKAAGFSQINVGEKPAVFIGLMF